MDCGCALRGKFSLRPPGALGVTIAPSRKEQPHNRAQTMISRQRPRSAIPATVFDLAGP
jgi:hypothetical protein